jgi:hypothetical protein
MTSTNGRRALEPLGQTGHVVAAERFARAIVLMFEVCEELRTPLSSVQKIAVLEAALLEFDGFEAQLRSLDEMDTLLRELDRR